MKYFKYRCQKVLPLVYDDSLSYYEVLCKLTNTINELIDAVNNNFEDYFNEYIENNWSEILEKILEDLSLELTYTYNSSTYTLILPDTVG